MSGVLPPALQGLKLAARDLVRAAGGGTAAAALCRVGQQKLSDCGNINLPDVWMGADIIADLEAVTRGLPGAPHVTRYLAQSAGFGLVALPEALAPGRSWLDHIAAITREGGDIIGKIISALGKGDVTAAVIRREELHREADELIRVAVEFKAALVAIDTG